MKGCVFAGTFDPITIGHEHVINECLSKYGKVLVVVGKNPRKTQLFSEEDRVALIKQAFSGQKDVEVLAYSTKADGYAEFLRQNDYDVYVRGIRNQADLKMENAMKDINAKLYPFIKTEYINVTGEVASVSSSDVRERILNGKDWLEYIPQKAQSLAKSLVDKLNDKQTEN